MLSPGNKLIIWTGITLIPAGIVCAISPTVIPFISVLIVLAFTAAIVDAAASFKSLDDIQVEMPETVRLTLKKKGSLNLRIINNGNKAAQIRIGLRFPEEIHTRYRDRLIRSETESQGTVVKWPCTPSKRGKYTLNRCCLESPSPWGLWTFRNTRKVFCEIRVYPDIRSGASRFAARFDRPSPGAHSRHQVGKGREFDRLREYLPGDAFEDICWKATARRGTPVTRIYQVERTQNVYVGIDISRLSGRAVNDKSETILDRFINSALVCGMAVKRQGDHFGIFAFDRQVRRFVKAGSGMSHFTSCMDTLYNLEHTGFSPDFAELSAFVSTQIRQRSLIILLTQMDDPVMNQNLIKSIHPIRKTHLLVIAMIRPGKAQPLFSAPVHNENEIYDHLSNHFQWADLQDFGMTLRRLGTGFLPAEADGLLDRMIAQYLDIKRRQAL